MNAMPRRGLLFAVRLLVLLLALLAAGCAQPDGERQGQTTVTLLTYQEQEAGVEPYPLRVLVNERFLRFDDGYDASDYMLMERDTGTIYSVSHEDQTILVISGYPAAAAAPQEIVLTEERDIDTAAPEIAGVRPEYIRFLASGTVCYHAVVAPGLLEQASLALAEYATALANRQFSDMATVPEDMQTPCFLSRYVYAPARHLHYGLPISVWDESGYHRTLLDFKEGERVAADLFVLPERYERFRPGG
jgi:hypothetical protein